jgi:hypothetical protein
MKGLTVINGIFTRTWRAQTAALVLTLIVFALGVTTTARAQGHAGGGGGGTGKVSMRDFAFSTNVGVTRGQTVRLRIAIANNKGRMGTATGKLYLATDVGVFVSRVKVFDAITNAEIRSFELRNPTPGIHTFDIGGSGDDLLIGGDTTYENRIQLRLEVIYIVCYDKSTNEFGAGIYAPTFEIFETDSGRTTVQGGLVKVGGGQVLLSNANTY